MQRDALQTFTKDPAHWGTNNHLTLANFLNYIEACQDPLHVYQYMQEKSICTFMPQYWHNKASLYFDMGEYQTCFLCLQEAEGREEMSRGDLQEVDSKQRIDISRAKSDFRSKMRSEMRKFPMRSKRSVDQFMQTSNYMETPKEEENSIERLINLYKDSYKVMKEERKHQAVKAKEGLEKSWMYEHYHQQSEKGKEIEEMIASQPKEHPNFISTPNNRFKLSKKISKTVDSVELLKKRNTVEKSFRFIQRNGHQVNREEMAYKRDQQELDIDPLPMTEIKRKVTFDTTFTKMAQVRSNIDRTKIARFNSFSFTNTNPESQPLHLAQPQQPHS